MANYITVDGGTTNTRIYLVQGGKVVDSIKCGIGATAGKSALCETLKSGIAKLLCDNNLAERNIEKLLLSGMITSEFGLCELPHTTVPAGIKELKRGSKEMLFEDICSIPFVFVPGVKTDCATPISADMMRGEETEVIGLWGIYGDGAYLLPGSHSKLVILEKGKITSIKTMMTGEMIASLSGETILKDAVDLSIDEYDTEYLIKGFELAENLGLNEALFKTRILKILFDAKPRETYGYFLGVVLADEIKAVASSGAERVIIGGKSILKRALAELLSAKTCIAVTVATEQEVDTSTALGAVKIFKA